MDRNEAQLLDEIITRVLEKLSKHQLCVVKSKRLVGIDKPIADLNSLLKKESEQVRVIGIWGMGGIGKTTIAEEIFSQNRSDYDGCCFLEKVSERLKAHGGIGSLKESLLSELLKESVKELSSGIERRIGRMKVLIVLDDVNETDLLEMLFGSLDWFRLDSRIIVTSRNKQVLVTNEVDNDDLCEVRVLDSSEALELFNLNAFKQSHLEMEYYELSERVIEYAKGVPLVLKVLAHMLRGKCKEVWESKLDKLKRLPIPKVHDVMRLSYDDLDRLEQKYFLDIACFFNGLDLELDYMKHLLKDCDSDNYVAGGLETLKDKALITISEDNVISMHDILQEMGWEVVRQESSDLGKCSRLWDVDDIFDVLKNDKGSDAIRSIRVDFLENRKLKLSPHVFDKMTNLQFLNFWVDFDDYLDLFPQGLESFPTGLRYLHWVCYPLKSFPEKFSAENLVILDLYLSRMEKLWCGVQNLVNLKEVTISLASLKELPDFSKATNLKVLTVTVCPNLESVHPSIFTLEKLVRLDLGGCRSLTTFTSNSNLSSLHYLSLSGCEKLSEFSVTLENIVELDLSWCPINALPSSFGCQSNLETLVLKATQIESIPSSIKDLTRLRKLNICGCKKLLALPELPLSVEILDLRSCNIEIIPSSIKNLTRLRKLDIRFSNKLLALPELSSSVEILLVHCDSLKSVLFPSTVAEQFKENKKEVKFWNCLNLDERSLINIGLNLQINLMKFAYQDLSTVEHDDYVETYVDYKDNFDSYQALYVYSGSSVPDWFEYKTTNETTNDDMIVDLSPLHLSPLLGFVFCFILPENEEYDKKVEFNITTIDVEGDGEKDGFNIYTDLEHVFNTQSDHVCMIYDQPCSQYLTRIAKNQTSFKIKVTARSSVLKLKGFGMSPINQSTHRNLIQQMEIKEAEKKEEATKQSVTKVGR
ncbi:LRR and NB-ARC domain disease resistance protein [Medicago truncatula]|uniref:LRR and NB-ARC domain disease resistance protein n=1 Tax=Medicago truncatula TaxID=3880 RepID=G7JKM1_MEDTR|nr:LRR and NB-ARC domain disease resistance protein [Medicago truncatula]